MEKTVGPYRLGDSLGALPFGELVTATHAARSEPLAVLLLDDRLAKDHRFRGLLRLEMARAGGLRHPALARSVEVGEHAGALYVVVERPADAQTLAEALTAGTPLSGTDAVVLIRTLAEGLDAAHGRRLVHGALGPAGVLLGPGGGATLVGVGLLAAVEEAGLGAGVADRADPAYVAPEQQTGRRAVASADAYALGVLAGTLLGAQSAATGQGDAVAAVLARQASADPAARFPTCAAFASALAEALAPAAPADAVAVPPEPAPPDRRTESASFGSPAPALPRHLPAPASEPSTPHASTGRAGRSAVEGPATPDAPARPAAVSGGGLRSVVDPPPTARPARATVAADTDVTVTALALTPAMAAVLKQEPPPDPIGDGVRMLAERVPAVDQVVNRFSQDGKIGPLPLGVAVAAALAVLLLVAGQAWPATVLAMIVVVLYGVPKLGAALTASERADPRAARVTGTAHLKRTPDAIGAGSPRLVLANGDSLGLRGPEYDALAPFGRPITIQRPAPGTTGVVDVVVSHELRGVGVTYLEPNRLLLDVRLPDGTVIYRRPPYQGEPGDRVRAPAGDQSPRPGVRADADASRPPVDAPLRPAPGQAVTLPLPPAGRDALQGAARREIRKAGAILGGGLIALGVLPQILGDFGFYVFTAVLIVLFKGAPTIMRAFSLWSAREATTMVRVVGSVTLLEYASGKSHSYFVHLTDGTRIKADGDTHRALAYAGELRFKETGVVDIFDVDTSRRSPDGDLQSQHEIVGATTTYLPGGALLLEIVAASGETVYRDPVLKEGDLGPVRPLV